MQQIEYFHAKKTKTSAIIDETTKRNATEFETFHFQEDLDADTFFCVLMLFVLFLFFVCAQIYDGPDVYSPVLLEKSGRSDGPFTVVSSSDRLHVRFTSSPDSKSGSGFLAVYDSQQQP